MHRNVQHTARFSGPDLTFSRYSDISSQTLNLKSSLGHYIQRRQLHDKTFFHSNPSPFLSPFISFLSVVTKSKILQKRFNSGLNKIIKTSENILLQLRL